MKDIRGFRISLNFYVFRNYIDDAALGIPLVHKDTGHMYDSSVMRPYVDWVRVSEMLSESGILAYIDLMDIINKFNKQY